MKLRMEILDPSYPLSMRKQSSLLKVSRSNCYYNRVINNDSELCIMIKDIYISSDCRYGYRKITFGLNRQGVRINGKKVLRLMQEMKIQGLYPKQNIKTTIKNKNHHIYPYLLQDLEIFRPNQVWATDITYIKIGDKFMYFTAIMDIYSRYILSHDLSHSLETESCIIALEEALKRGKPDIFNTDQGTQFTSNAFIEILKNAGINISMDHKGRCFDNIFVERLWRTIKQEAVYFYRVETVAELEECLNEFVLWYNNERFHQSLGYKTPKEVYYND